MPRLRVAAPLGHTPGLKPAGIRCTVSVGLRTRTQDRRAFRLIPGIACRPQRPFPGLYCEVAPWRAHQPDLHGRERCVLSKGNLKATGLSLEQVLNSRLPGPRSGIGLKKPSSRVSIMLPNGGPMSPADLLVDVTGDDGTSRRNVPLREA